MMLGFGEYVTERIDWSQAQVLRGDGQSLAAGLREFIGCRVPEEMPQLWWGLEGVVFSQNTIYGSSEATVDVLMSALIDDRPDFVRSWILEALRLILTGGSTDDVELPGRCRQRARLGAWLLASEASDLSLNQEDRDEFLAVLELIDSPLAALVRVVSWQKEQLPE